jgi:hypothetical protein
MERDPNRQAIEDARFMTRSAQEAVVQAAGQRERLNEMRRRNAALRERIRRSLRRAPSDRD